jgi:chain length determinant protein EpsF
MDINQFLLALSARRKAFAMVLAITVLAAVVVSLALPKRFVSSTTLLIDGRDEQSMTVERLSPRERAGYMQTQADLIQSGRVAQKVVRDLKLTQRPGVREEFERDTGGVGSIDEWLASQLVKKLRVDTAASNIITVEFSAPEPKLATDVVNGFAKAYVETTLSLRTEPSREASEWFEEQLKGIRSIVAQAQSRLFAYQKEKGLIGVDERGDVEIARMNEISTQLLAARNATYDAQTRAKHAQEIIAGGAPAESLPEILNSPVMATVKADLARAEGRLEEFSGSLGPNHPQMLRAQSEVQAARERVAAETKKIVSGLSNAALQSRKREEELKNALAGQQDRLISMRDARVELAVLTRDVETSQRAYDAAMARYMTSKVDSRARQTNVAVLTPAAVPLRHKFPQVGLITALSVLVGTLLAAGVVYVLETLDRRVRSRSDLESRLAVPILGRLSKWQPTGGRLLPAPVRTARALPHPW